MAEILRSRWASLALIVLALAVNSCTEEKVGVKLSVAAKTNKGDPVAGAIVVLGKPGSKDMAAGKKLGETNNLGVFYSEILLDPGSKVTFNVIKQSDTYYFAPHTQLVEIDRNEKQEVLVEAVLYFVPKPSPDDSTRDVTEDAPKAEEIIIEKSEKEIDLTEDQEVVVDEPAVAEASEEQSSEATVAEDSFEDVPQEEDLAVETEEPKKIDLKLANVQSEPTTETLPSQDYPKSERSNDGEIVYTVHTLSDGEPVSEATVFIGQEKKGDLKKACTTNARGRCAIRFPSTPEGSVNFVARKVGYRTKSSATAVKNKGSIRIEMVKGHTIDVFAITRNYNFTKGLEGVRVSINGRQVGVTDRYGHYAHTYTGKKDDLLTVTLKSAGHLPEEFETDFVASGEMTLSRYFSPRDPPPVKMTLLDMVPAGKITKEQTEIFTGALDRTIRRAALKHIYSSSAFAEYPLISFNREAKRNGQTPTKLLQEGWQETDMKALVDALLKPTVVFGSKPTLELTAIDSKGKVLAAAKENLDGLEDEGAIDRALAVLAKKLTRVFPFEGAVTSRNADSVTINIGYESGRAIARGDELDIYGVQADKLGRSQTHMRIGRLRVKDVGANTSEASILSAEARTIINRGDLVVLRGRSAPTVTQAKINVEAGEKPVPRANVYFKDTWIGSTDEQGRIYTNAKGSGPLRVIRHGFQDYQKQVDLARAVNISLEQETAFLRVESEPTNAIVRIDGKVIGNTPLRSPIPVPAGFAKLQIDGPTGYKSLQQVLELDQGTLDLTGVNAVNLERDLLGDALKLLTAGKVEAAIEKLKAVPAEHSDFLVSRHELGEIFLTRTAQPADAAKAFGEVTSNPRVAQYADKRFIGTHINEGIALFMTAENLVAEQPEVAAAHYQKAIEVLEGVSPHLRFVPRDQYAQAVHNVDYHRALSRHRLWTVTKNPGTLNDALRSWQAYLDGSATSVSLDEGGDLYVKNAEVYMKQAKASLAIVQKQALNQ